MNLIKESYSSSKGSSSAGSCSVDRPLKSPACPGMSPSDSIDHQRKKHGVEQSSTCKSDNIDHKRKKHGVEQSSTCKPDNTDHKRKKHCIEQSPTFKYDNIDHKGKKPVKQSPTSKSDIIDHKRRKQGVEKSPTFKSDRIDQKRKKQRVEQSPVSKSDSIDLKGKKHVEQSPTSKSDSINEERKKQGVEQSPTSKSGSIDDKLKKQGVEQSPTSMYIPGLTIHLPMNFEKLKQKDIDPLMILFESCKRSNIRIKFDQTREEFETAEKQKCSCQLFIHERLISEGVGEMLRECKDKAARKALDILRQCQPCKYKNKEKMFLIQSDVPINGLTLHFQRPSHDREHWYSVLVESCAKSNIPLTWWDDRGQVFATRGKTTTVLLINDMPITRRDGWSLREAKRETAIKAVGWLRTKQSIVYAVDEKDEGYQNDCKNLSILPLTSAIPGLVMHLPHPESKHDRSAESIIMSSASQSSMSVKVRNEGCIQKTDDCELWAARLVVGDVGVARSYGYGKIYAISNAWKVGLRVLLKVQPISYEKSVGPTGRTRKPRKEELRNQEQEEQQHQQLPLEQPEFQQPEQKPNTLFITMSDWFNKETDLSKAMDKTSDHLIQEYLDR